MAAGTKAAGTKAAGAKASTRNDGAHKTVTPSPELAAIVGDKPLKRTEIVSKLWEYIRGNNLQKPSDKRQILADETLKKVVGKDEVSMFELNKHVSAHVK